MLLPTSENYQFYECLYRNSILIALTKLRAIILIEEISDCVSHPVTARARFKVCWGRSVK